MGAAAYANDFGVQVQVDVPLESIAIFPANPLGYDLVSISAFYEFGAYGGRFDLLSGKEISLGAYYRVWAMTLGSNGIESTVGFYTGYNWAGEGWFFRLRGKFILYGSH